MARSAEVPLRPTKYRQGGGRGPDMSATVRHPKAVRQDYSPGPFFFAQTNASGAVRLVGWTGDVSQLESLFYRLMDELPDDVDVLLKIKREESAENRPDDPWQRYHGPASRAAVVKAVESCAAAIFQDSEVQLCVRDPLTSEYVVLDEDGIVFVYSDAACFQQVFRECGFVKQLGTLINEAGRWNYSPQTGPDARARFIEQLRLEPVDVKR